MSYEISEKRNCRCWDFGIITYTQQPRKEHLNGTQRLKDGSEPDGGVRGESQARNKYDYYESGEVWVRIGKNKWQCRNCGAIIESECAPEKCPVCDHPKAYFQLEQNNF